ncbi:hypothetical protein FCJ60_12095 [Burkholderia metallica]|nr:hypothetical protein [Burkholderia metallica]
MIFHEKRRPAKPFRPVRLRLAPPSKKRKSPEKSGLFFLLSFHPRKKIARSGTRSPRITQAARVTTPAGAALVGAWSGTAHRSSTHRVSALPD